MPSEMPDISPPSYDVYPYNEPTLGSPTYSASPRHAEISLMSDSSHSSPPPSPTTCHGATQWSYETKHMKINLAPQIWKSSCPAYGSNANIEGLISLSISKECVEKVTIDLELEFVSCVPTKFGAYTISSKLRHISLYESEKNTEWKNQLPFSFSIPSTITIGGNECLTPPSFYCANFATPCQTCYSVKIILTKKGGSLRKTESKTIQILYLPKSCPTSPPMSSIPRPASIRSVAISPAYLHMFDRVFTIPIPPSWPVTDKPNPNVDLSFFQHCINFSVPTPKCYTSGDAIPFSISVCCTEQPTLPALLLQHIRVNLYKRVSIITCPKVVGSDSHNRSTVKVYGEWPIAYGHLRFQNEYAEGLVFYRGFVSAGSAGKECSFVIPDLLEVQYFLRVTITPPKYLSGHVPCFKHDEFVDLTTDRWGTLDRELTATGGMPTPALGLATPPLDDDEVWGRWGWPIL